jgi:hypothetical protein
MESSLFYVPIEVVVKRVVTSGDGLWVQKQFCTGKNFEIPSRHCWKLYGGLACKAWLVVQASFNFGQEQTEVKNKPR